MQFVVSLRQAAYEGPLVLISAEHELPYHKPPLSKAFLKNSSQGLQYFRSEKFYQDHDVEVRLGTSVEAIDTDKSQIVLEKDEVITYQQLVLATGARPRLPDLAQIELDGVMALRTADDAGKLRQAAANTNNIVIMGGGFVGLEVASTLVKQGKNVTVIEAAPRILGRAVAPHISEYIHTKLETLGVRLLLDTTIDCIEGDQLGVKCIVPSVGSTIDTRLLLVGIGAEVNIELAESAGLACNNGITVDEQMRTSVKNILAIGDCTNYMHWLAKRHVRLESVQNATDQARLAVKTVLGDNQAYRAVPWFWSEIADVKLQMTGLSFDADDFIITGSIEQDSFSVYHFCGAMLVSVDSVNRPQDHMLGRKFFDNGFMPTKQDVKQGTKYLKEIFSAFKA